MAGRERIRAVCVAIFLGFAVGCSDSPYSPVRGVVTFDGKPVADATVGFSPKDVTVGRPAFGVTGSEGNYELSTLEPGDGVLPGEYHVTVTAVDIVESEKAKKMAEEYGSLVGDMRLPKPKETWRIPEAYSETETSGLEFTVKDGRNTANWAIEK